MAMKISVCGKGGSGKSTLVMLLASVAQAKGLKVLIVDSDESNSGFFRMAGFEAPPVPLMELVGGKQSLKQTMGEENVLSEAEIPIESIPHQYILKKDGLMLVSIGKIHQALEGCACPMGVLSREFLRKLRLNEDEVVIVDTEAGVEHFGRGIDTSIDTILLVVEPSFESIALAETVKSLAKDIEKNVWTVLNKIPSEDIASRMIEEMKSRGLRVIGVVPYDMAVFEAGLGGAPLQYEDSLTEAEKILNFLLSDER